jgi:hypothetical protein
MTETQGWILIVLVGFIGLDVATIARNMKRLARRGEA